MELKWFIRLLIFIVCFIQSADTSAQITTLSNQAQVNAFAGTKKVNGSLLVRGDDITDLSALKNLDTITHNLFIEYNRKLKVLNGLDSLVFIGGSLFIDSNTELDSIGSLERLNMVKGLLVLRHNASLRECCGVYPLLAGLEGRRLWGGALISGNKGCRSEKELRENCDADTDNDGVDDSNDACPNDPNKVNPGICGCGVADQDSDNDGTPDCNDKCPNDPNKTAPGSCGCGRHETDSDNDGVADCIDECPSNPAITKAGICGCLNPRILDIKVENIGNCSDNGTPSAADDTYPVDVTILFEGAPNTGRLLVTGGTTTSINFATGNTEKSVTLLRQPFRADGKLIEVIATFEGNPRCTKRRVFGIFGKKSCSSGACEPPTSINIDAESIEGSVQMTWTDLGIGTEYEVDYKPVGTTNWATKAAKTNQLIIGDLADFTTYDYRIRSVCDGQKFSAYKTGQFTSGGKVCKLIRAQVQNINCQDNETPDDLSDDYFTFDLFVEGSNVGANYQVSSVQGMSFGTYGQLSTFRTADSTLGQGDISISITDTVDTNCQISATVTDPGVCSNDCSIQYVTLDTLYKCYDRGSRWNTKDDFFTADVTVYFTNAPALGELILTGDVRGKVETANLQNTSSYTFQKRRIPTSGKEVDFTASFTNGLDCEYTTTLKGLLLERDQVCQKQCQIMGVQVANVQCVDNGTVDKNDDYLTFEVVATGINLGDTYQMSNVAGNSTGTYNQPAFFRTNSGEAGTSISFTLTDNQSPDCQYTVSLANACGGQSKIGALLANPFDAKSSELKLYPNPARAEIFLDYENITSATTIEIFDLLGQRVIQQVLTNNRINISDLDRGLYHLVVRTGTEVSTQKFVKE
ncbi:MAG: T9SS type A sorting domain-containing protein [Bacteroidota bacterium]